MPHFDSAQCDTLLQFTFRVKQKPLVFYATLIVLSLNRVIPSVDEDCVSTGSTELATSSLDVTCASTLFIRACFAIANQSPPL